MAFDLLLFETLNLKAMHRLWGGKVGDLGFADFLFKAQWMAKKLGRDRLLETDDENLPSVWASSGYVPQYADLCLRWLRICRVPRCERGQKHLRGGSPSRGRETPVRPRMRQVSLSPPYPTRFSRGSASIEQLHPALVFARLHLRAQRLEVCFPIDHSFGSARTHIVFKFVVAPFFDDRRNCIVV